MLQNLQYLKEFLSFLNLLDSFPFSHTLFPFLSYNFFLYHKAWHVVTILLYKSITKCILHRTTEVMFCSRMTCDCFQSRPTRPHKEVSCLCRLPVPKKQRVGRSTDQGGAAKVMKSHVVLADRKSLEAGSEEFVTLPMAAALCQAASPSDLWL